MKVTKKLREQYVQRMLATNECRIFLSSSFITLHQNILRPVTLYGWKTWCFTV